jgi:hypothetical protein
MKEVPKLWAMTWKMNLIAKSEKSRESSNKIISGGSRLVWTMVIQKNEFDLYVNIAIHLSIKQLSAKKSRPNYISFNGLGKRNNKVHPKSPMNVFIPL